MANFDSPRKQASTARKSGISKPKVRAQDAGVPVLKVALPVVFVSNVQTSAAFFCDKLGFAVDFLYGDPPYYGSVSRDAARLHLRFVHEPAIDPGVREREEGLLSAVLEVDNIKVLYAEYEAAGVDFAQRLEKKPWGATGFTVLDPDGNWIYFTG